MSTENVNNTLKIESDGTLENTHIWIDGEEQKGLSKFKLVVHELLPWVEITMTKAILPPGSVEVSKSHHLEQEQAQID